MSLYPAPMTTEFTRLVSLSARDECWECGLPVSVPQQRHTMTTIEAILCTTCRASGGGLERLRLHAEGRAELVGGNGPQ